MIDIELDEEMEMPTPCQHCGEWFDLNNGYGSKKWHPNVVICSDCYDKESKEIERDDEIEELQILISDAEITIKDSKERLKELGFKFNHQTKINGSLPCDLCGDTICQCSNP